MTWYQLTTTFEGQIFLFRCDVDPPWGAGIPRDDAFKLRPIRTEAELQEALTSLPADRCVGTPWARQICRIQFETDD